MTEKGRTSGWEPWGRKSTPLAIALGLAMVPASTCLNTAGDCSKEIQEQVSLTLNEFDYNGNGSLDRHELQNYISYQYTLVRPNRDFSEQEEN